MIKVKLSTFSTKWQFFRQTPGEKGMWGDVQFFMNDNSVREYDYWIVYENLPDIEKAFCPESNVCLITGEPPSKKSYKRGFLQQFARVITCDRRMKHNNKIYWQQAQPWHIGRKQIEHRNIGFSKNYDELKTMDFLQKAKLLSVISSNKKKIKGHYDRLEFISFLKEYFKDRIDVFGRGINEIEDKWDAIAPYKYHIVLENSRFDDYITEKLSDAFLGEAYPIYYGAGNVYSYFSEDSLTCIDILKPSEAVKKIEMVIEGNYYGKYISNIRMSKMKVLDEYNLFPTIVDKFINTDKNKNKEKSEVILKPACYYGVRAIETTIKEVLPGKLKSFIVHNIKGTH
jgi:hypothetical protein